MGLIGAVRNNASDIAGMSWSGQTLLPIKVFGSDGKVDTATSVSVARGIDVAVRRGTRARCNRRGEQRLLGRAGVQVRDLGPLGPVGAVDLRAEVVDQRLSAAALLQRDHPLGMVGSPVNVEAGHLAVPSADQPGDGRQLHLMRGGALVADLDLEGLQGSEVRAEADTGLGVQLEERRVAGDHVPAHASFEIDDGFS